MTKGESRTRLWVITEPYAPELTSTGYYLTKIAEGLADDFEVRVICGQPNYAARGTTAPRNEDRNGVAIKRVPGTRLNKNVIPFRVLNMLTFGVSVLIACLLGFRKGDIVLAVTTPPLLPFLTSAACKIRKAKHILLIHDCYPEILYAAKKLKPGSGVARVLERLTKNLFVSADRVILVGRDMQSRISRKTAQKTDCYVIPNWAELETVSPSAREDNPLIERLGLKDKLIFQYAGNMGYPNDIESFIAVAPGLLKELPDVHFIFIGAGVKRRLLETAVKVKNLKNITLLDPMPRNEQQTFLNACDIGIVSVVSNMHGVSMPSRTYNILAAGKPVLAVCEPGSEVALVVEEEQIGWTSEPEDAASLAATIRDIYRRRLDLTTMGKNARRAATEKYSLEKALDKYKKALSCDASETAAAI